MRNYSAVSEVFGNHAKDTFSTIRITVASPDKIRSWSRGEVKNPETLNYRTFKPEKGGLFCEKIFGPTRDWECSCGKYRRFKHKGIVCDRCGVEVTHSRVRRERMGHIELAVPMSHVWFFKCMPSKLGLMMDMKSKDLERAIYYDSWMIIDPGDTPYSEKQLLTDEEYKEAREAYGDAFKAAMGAEGVKEVLKKIDLPAFREELSAKMAQTKSKTERKKITKRLRIVEGFCSANMRPEWMILDVLPVLPPDLRPLVPLEGGRFATSDLNDLYRRVINRNNRLKNLLTLKTPEVIIRNEKRMLQEAIDALMDNGRQGRPVTGSNNRQLKSLSDTLKGKQGRFRQNLLGKRVDYSGRSVIVVGPELKLNQCGLPKKMALTLFEPFIVHKLKKSGMAHTVRSAKKLIEEEDPKVWDILEEVIKGHPVLLNRAPTLHRLSIQAFDPVLIEGQAIRVHPMVCSAYNADFDGDQMAVHIPLSNEAQLETKLLMLATNNVFYPSSGKPICSPSQDITLGSYYLTYMKPGAVKRTKHPKAFSDAFEVIRLWDMGLIPIHQVIRLMNPNRGKDTFWGDKESKFIITTPGRCIFNDIWPEEMGFFNQVANKSSLGDLVSSAYSILGNEKTVTILDKLKETGYIYATKSGFSIGITDMIIPSEKAEIVAEGQKATEEVRNQYYNKGIITEGERYNRFIDIWTNAKNQIASVLLHTLERNNGSDEINSIYAMLDSGARGSNDQVRQLSGMRGLMAKPSGEIIQRPILSSFREGLSVLEFFISSHGARKGLADTALKTADSGYMTRKLVDVAHDLICTEEDCQTTQGIWVSPIREGDEEMLSLQERIVGRTSVDDIRDPLSQKDESIVQSGEEITLEIAGKIVAVGLDRVLIRSSLTCHSEGGICAKCYGRNLAIDGPIKKGDSIGIIAAQSIGEPGTQLTMRTFHYGGTASSSFKQPFIKARHDGVIKLIDARIVKTPEGSIILNKNAEIAICDEKGFEQERYQLMPGAILHKEEGESLEEEETFVHWDPYNIPVITEYGGKIKFVDLIEGITMKEEINETTGNREITVLEHREDLFPQILIIDDNDDLLAHYSIPAGAHIMVESGVKVNPGKILARRPRQVARTKDITGGLPRVAELFEARRPKNPAEIAKIDGIVELGTLSKGKRSLLVRDESGGIEEHLIPASKHIVVFDGESVKKGDPLTDGSVVPHEILDICGPQDLQRYLVNEIQTVYRLQGVEINDKHIEVIVRQMLRKIRVSETGDTKFLYGEQVDKTQFLEENNRIISEGGRAAEGQPVLLGITKASLETESFISAASFQDTTRILTDAATLGKVDILKGFKENVIVGHLIPAGTGYHLFQDIKIKEVGRPVSMTKKGILEDSDDEKSDDKYVSSMTTQEATQLL